MEDEFIALEAMHLSAKEIKPMKIRGSEDDYRNIPKIPWSSLKGINFDNPDWKTLYPLKVDSDAPVGLFTPRQACKLFYDGVLILDQAEESESGKFLQDMLPDVVQKYYKKKQWRNQLLEASKRVLCRLAMGQGFKTNCTGEDMFVHILVKNELGWGHCAFYWERLPECEKDRDMTKLIRFGSHEGLGFLYKIEPTSSATRFAVAKPVSNFKNWFIAVNKDFKSMHDHVLPAASMFGPMRQESLDEEDMDDRERRVLASLSPSEGKPWQAARLSKPEY